MAAQRSRQNQAREDKRRRAQAALAAARKNRNRQMWIAGSTLAVVIAIVVAFVVVKVAGGSGASTPTSAGASSGQASTVAGLVTSVPGKALKAVGAGSNVAPPVTLTGQPSLTADGHPRVVFIGAEYCPYCAAERWGLVTALSRFGTFSGLGLTTSSSTDVYANTPTLSFLHSHYSSSLLSFTSYETEDRNEAPLQTPSPADQALLAKYDTAKYVPNLTNDSAGSIPFVDIANRYLVVGSQISPQVLGGLTHLQVAKDLSDPTSDVAKAVDGEANVLTAALCRVTGGKPGSVCRAPGVTAAAATLSS